MIPSILKKVIGVSAVNSTSGAYALARKNECTTRSGAYALAQKLSLLMEACRFGGDRQRLYKRQNEVAEAAARRLRAIEELEVRIPQALDRNKKVSADALRAAQAELSAVDKEYGVVGDKLTSARQRLSAFETSLQSALQMAKSQLDAAGQRLRAAEIAQDFDAIGLAGDEVGDAERSLASVEESHLGLRQKIGAMQKVCADLEAESSRLQDRKESASSAASAAESFVAFVKSDRQMLAAMIALVEALSNGGAAIPLLNGSGAIFLVREHFPYWREGGNDCMVPVDLLRRLASDLAEPDWASFEKDPATIDEPAPAYVPPDLVLDALNAGINRTNSELINAFRQSGSSNARITVGTDGA